MRKKQETPRLVSFGYGRNPFVNKKFTRPVTEIGTSSQYERHSRDNPDLDPGQWRTLQVPHHIQVVPVTGVAGVGDVLGCGIDRYGNHVRAQPGSASGSQFSGVLPP